MQFSASIKISELDPITSSVDTDFIPIVISASMTTYRINKGYFIPPPLQYVSGSNYSSWSYCSTQSLNASQSSWATQSLFAISASWASRSLVAISASWASASISSQYTISASWASASISSSYALSASWAPNPLLNQESASWASQSLSASWAPPSPYDSLPIGTIISIAYKKPPIPVNFLECNGQTVLSSSFSELLAVITASSTAEFGYKCNSFGAADPTGLYFKLPDLRGEFVRGWDNGRGIDIGRSFGDTQADAVIAHTHAVILSTNTIPSSVAGVNVHSTNGTFGASTATYTSNAYGSSTETRPKNVSLMYIIKYSNAANFMENAAYTLAGDATGPVNGTLVQGIQNVPVSSTTPTTGQVLGYNGSSWEPTNAAGTSPTGMVSAFATTGAPSGWLICSGSLILISSYSALSTAIWVGNSLNPLSVYGYKADVGGSRNTSGLYIKLPDLCGRFVRGFSAGGTYDTARVWASEQPDSVGPHTHIYSKALLQSFHPNMADLLPGPYNSTTLYNSATITNTGTETVPRNVTLIYCIKT